MKLSIITINRNNATGLRKTMESVLKQTYRDFEYIVVDGASDDGSVGVIKEFEQKINPSLQGEELCSIEGPVDVHRTNNGVGFFTWISEPDTGIYNAMNKGIRMSHGEYTLMLNSGDYLVDEYVINRVISELHTEDIIQGNIIEDYPEKTIRNRGYGRSDLSFVDVMDGFFLHQATFIKLSTIEKYGYYDENYKKAADSYFFITAMALGNASFRYIDIDIANFDINGISSMQDPKWRLIDKEEDERWYGEHISKRLMEFYQAAPKKMIVYDKLHQYKLIWYITMLLVHMVDIISPIGKKVKTEKFNEYI